jgi:hypothetical protein
LTEGKWTHVAVTLGTTGARLYKNGELVNKSTDVTIRPIDFKPILNYIGRAQTEVPLFDGKMDDFRIYNYELTAEEITELFSDVPTDVAMTPGNLEARLILFPIPANDILNFKYDTQTDRSKAILRLYDVHGRLILQEDLQSKQKGEINVSDLPSGIYLLNVTGRNIMSTAKIVIKH